MKATVSFVSADKTYENNREGGRECFFSLPVVELYFLEVTAKSHHEPGKKHEIKIKKFKWNSEYLGNIVIISMQERMIYVRLLVIL